MSVPTTADLDLTNLRLDRLIRPMIRAGAIGCGGLLLFAAVFIWIRRAMGAISTPLSTPSLLAVGLAVAVLSLGARLAWNRTHAARGATLGLSVLLSVATFALAAATSLPESAPLGLVALWLAVAGEELWAWRPKRRVNDAAAKEATSRPHAVPVADGHGRFEQAVADSSLGAALPQEHVTQQVTRLVEPDGTERVVGWMRVSFEPGQRLASVHLAFCPPFQRAPEAVLERLDGPAVRIKRVQVFPFGARFDLKLNAPAEQSLNVLLQIVAEAQGPDATDGVRCADNDR